MPMKLMDTELFNMYKARSEGMEKELNKIKELVGISEDDIPEPDQVFNAVKKTIKELSEAYEVTDVMWEGMFKTLKEDNEKLKAENERLEAEIHAYENTEYDDIQNIEELKAEIKKLKEITDGIMDDENSQHILGCNAYEKFCQAMCELNHDEKWIKELKAENEKLKADAEDDKKIYECNRRIVERQREAHKKTMAEIKNKPFTVIKGDSMTIDFNKIEAMIEENKRLKEANEEQNRIIMDMTDIVD